MPSNHIAESAHPSRPAVWRDPAMIGIAAAVVLASGWVLFENRINPPKPVDVTTKVPLAGGGAFCDPIPLPQPSSTH